MPLCTCEGCTNSTVLDGFCFTHVPQVSLQQSGECGAVWRPDATPGSESTRLSEQLENIQVLHSAIRPRPSLTPQVLRRARVFRLGCSLSRLPGIPLIFSFVYHRQMINELRDSIQTCSTNSALFDRFVATFDTCVCSVCILTETCARRQGTLLVPARYPDAACCTSTSSNIHTHTHIHTHRPGSQGTFAKVHGKSKTQHPGVRVCARARESARAHLSRAYTHTHTQARERERKRESEREQRERARERKRVRLRVRRESSRARERATEGERGEGWGGWGQNGGALWVSFFIF
jgi:hypothetical protein